MPSPDTALDRHRLLDQLTNAAHYDRFRSAFHGGCALAALTILVGLVPLAGAEPAPEPEPWPAKVPNWRPVQRDEHPRLFFRKGDLPELRKRAQTAEGQAILKRLRFLLNGGDGESMPTVFNEHPPVNVGALGYEHPIGKTFTHWHAGGYGLLYQLTGDRRYADLARQCVEKTLAGQADRDERYSWTEPGTGFRAGAIMGALGLAYDLNHDGWDDAFRKQVCEAIIGYQAQSARLNSPGKPARKRKT